MMFEFQPLKSYSIFSPLAPSFSSPLHPALHRTLSPVGKDLSPVSERTPTFFPHHRSKLPSSHGAEHQTECSSVDQHVNVQVKTPRLELGQPRALFHVISTREVVGVSRIFSLQQLSSCVFSRGNQSVPQPLCALLVMESKTNVPDSAEGEAAGNWLPRGALQPRDQFHDGASPNRVLGLILLRYAVCCSTF